MSPDVNNKSYGLINIIILAVVLVSLGVWVYGRFNKKEKHFDSDINKSSSSIFEYSFNVDGSLEEAGSPQESASKYWWLDSGGMLTIHNGMGSTIQGDLPDNHKWRMVYASSNATDTDDGRHPQNIFRLLTRDRWKNLRQEMYFRVNDDNMSDSPGRNESNGLLLLSRFTDTGDLYYAGLRVDGRAIVKKKIDGTYHTLVDEVVIPGTYSRDSKTSLLPKNTWIGLRSEVTSYSQDHVKIRLYTDIGQTGNWTLVADADDTESEDGKVINEKGYGGVRLDFMDVDFKDYKAEELEKY